MTKFVRLEEYDAQTISPQVLFIGMTNLLERMDRLEEVVADMASIWGVEMTGNTVSEELMNALVVSLSKFVEALQQERDAKRDAALEFTFLNSPE